jgi:acid phosphatase
MTTLIPRQFYSQEELDKLYPKELELQLVQIVSADNVTSLCATTD